MKEQTRKILALVHLEQALAAGGKCFQLKLIDDETVEVIDLESSAVKHVRHRDAQGAHDVSGISAFDREKLRLKEMRK